MWQIGNVSLKPLTMIVKELLFLSHADVGGGTRSVEWSCYSTTADFISSGVTWLPYSNLGYGFWVLKE
jgi:hypothetical protein